LGGSRNEQTARKNAKKVSKRSPLLGCFHSPGKTGRIFSKTYGPIKLVAPIIKNFITVVIKIQNWQNYKQEIFKFFK